MVVEEGVWAATGVSGAKSAVMTQASAMDRRENLGDMVEEYFTLSVEGEKQGAAVCHRRCMVLRFQIAAPWDEEASRAGRFCSSAR
jgi:hypothetical protein